MGGRVVEVVLAGCACCWLVAGGMDVEKEGSAGGRVEPAPLLCSTRLGLSIIGFFMFFHLYAQRVGMSVAIVSMVNQTAVSMMAEPGILPLLLQSSSPFTTKTNKHAGLTAFCPGLPGSAVTRKVKPIWILLKQETVSGRGISWAICKSAPRSRQITMPAPHHSVFLHAGCPSCCPTNSVKALKACY